MKMQKAKFIQLIRRHPILYDLSHDEYKNLRKKDKIWDELGMEFNQSGEYLKRKWKSLRDTFAKYMKRVNSEGVSKPWVWANQMEFFLPHLAANNKLLQEKGYENPPYSDCEYENSDSNMLAEENEYVIAEYNDDDEPIESVVFVQDSPVKPETSTKRESPSFNITQPRSLKRKVDDSEQESSLRERFENKKIKAVFDEMECLLLAHAKTIKKFSPKRQAITKYKIAQVILEQELLHVQELPVHTNNRHRGRSASSDD